MKLKLKDDFQAQSEEKVQFHARALRAIGQDLGKLFPQSLDITLNGINFQVSGRCMPRNAGEKGAPRGGYMLDKLRSKLLGDQAAAVPAETPPETVSFDRMYAPADIERIDEIGANHRHGADTLPDLYSLAEILRMVGRILDSDGNRLCRLTKDSYGVTFEFEDSAGQKHKRELSNLQLYKLQQQYYGERGTFVPVDKWRGSL